MDYNINRVDKTTQKAVDTILNSDGIKGVSCDEECTKLQGLLNGTKGKDEKAYVQSYIDEWISRKEAEAKRAEAEENKAKKQDGTEKKEVTPEPTVPENKKEEKSIPTTPKKKAEAEENKAKKQDGVEKKEVIPERKPKEQNQPNITNNTTQNTTNQGGNHNINAASGSTVIIVNTPFQGANATGEATTVTQTDSSDNKNDQTVDTKSQVQPALTAKEMDKARKDGKDVAGLLFDYTDPSEQRLIKDIINKEMNSDTVVEFLRGYKNAQEKENAFEVKPFSLGLIGLTTHFADQKDDFFLQMHTEYGFDESENLIKKAGTDLKGYIQNKYGVDSQTAKEIEIILMNKITEESVKKLDNIATREVNKTSD